jgi:hypothetical protein
MGQWNTRKSSSIGDMDIRAEVIHCKDCNRIPKNGSCECKEKNGKWKSGVGVPATDEIRKLLASRGFRETTDKDGDVYYLGPGDFKIWINPNGTWRTCEDVPQGLQLETYLDDISKLTGGPAL